MEMTVVGYRAAGKDAAWVELETLGHRRERPDGKALPPLRSTFPRCW